MTQPEFLATFVRAWLTDDAAERRRSLEQCWADDGVFIQRNSVAEGRDALAETIEQGIRNWPTGATIPTSDVEEHHNWLRYRWKIVGGDGAVYAEGLHVAERGDDGRVKMMITFNGPPPALD